MAIAAVVRLLAFAENAASPFLAVPVLDEIFYDEAARALAHGDLAQLAALNPGFRPLLYPALIAVVYVLGGGPAIVIALQHLLGAATAGLVAWCALLLFERPAAGFFAGLVYALAAPPIFFEGQLLIAATATFLATVWLALALRLAAAETFAWSGWIALGLATTVLAQARANALVLLAVPFVVAFWPGSERPDARRGAVAALAAAALGLLLVAAIQTPVVGSFRPLPGAGGVNLYLGNKIGADGRIPRQDEHASYGSRYRDSVEVFAERAAAEAGVSADASSAYWLGRTVDDIAAAPQRWLALMGRKMVWLVWNHEIANNRSFAFAAAEESPILGRLPVRFALLLALAGAGGWIAWAVGARRRLLWPLAFLGFWGVGVILFFVAARFRLPMWPALAVLAGGIAPAVLDFWRARKGRPGAFALDRRQGAIALGLALGLATISAIDWFGVGAEPPFRDHFFRSIARQHLGDIDGALSDARRAVVLAPSDPASIFQLGSLHLARDEPEEALEQFERVVAIASQEPRGFHNLGIAFEDLGQPNEAYAAYVRATQLAPDYAPPWVSLGLLELRAQRLDTARGRIARAAALGNASIPMLIAQARLAALDGDHEASAALLRRAHGLDREITRRTLERLRRPLQSQAIAVDGAG